MVFNWYSFYSDYFIYYILVVVNPNIAGMHSGDGQLGLISIKTGSPFTWNPETEEIANNNAASALLNIPIREKYFKF